MKTLLPEKKFLCNVSENLMRPSLNTPGYILSNDAIEN